MPDTTGKWLLRTIITKYPATSLRVVADRQGNIVRCIEYESFGCVTRDTNPALYLGYGFAGGLHDPDVGTVRFWLRDYDPALGRFLTPDPAHRGGKAAAGQEASARREAGKGQPAVDPDRYGYCLDDPVNMADETGMFGFLLPFVAGLAGATGLAGTTALGAARVVDKIADVKGLRDEGEANKATEAVGGAMGRVAAINAGIATTAAAATGATQLAPPAFEAMTVAGGGAAARAGDTFRTAAKAIEPHWYAHAGKAQIAAEMAKGAFDFSTPPSTPAEHAGSGAKWVFKKVHPRIMQIGRDDIGDDD